MSKINNNKKNQLEKENKNEIERHPITEEKKESQEKIKDENENIIYIGNFSNYKKMVLEFYIVKMAQNMKETLKMP